MSIEQVGRQPDRINLNSEPAQRRSLGTVLKGEASAIRVYGKVGLALGRILLAQPLMNTKGGGHAEPSADDPTRSAHGDHILQPDEVAIVEPEDQGDIELILSEGEPYRRALPGVERDRIQNFGQRGGHKEKIIPPQLAKFKH